MGGIMAQGWAIVTSTILSAVMIELIEVIKARHWGVKHEK
jgi:hypothetical protein